MRLNRPEGREVERGRESLREKEVLLRLRFESLRERERERERAPGGGG